MAREVDNGWLQWSPAECVRINRFSYLLLCCIWPLLRMTYVRRLVGGTTTEGRMP